MTAPPFFMAPDKGSRFTSGLTNRHVGAITLGGGLCKFALLRDMTQRRDPQRVGANGQAPAVGTANDGGLRVPHGRRMRTSASVDVTRFTVTGPPPGPGLRHETGSAP